MYWKRLRDQSRYPWWSPIFRNTLRQVSHQSNCWHKMLVTSLHMQIRKIQYLIKSFKFLFLDINYRKINLLLFFFFFLKRSEHYCTQKQVCSHTCWNGSPSLHTEEQRAGSWHQKRKRRKFSSLSVRNESSFHPHLRKSFWLDLNQSKIYLRLGILWTESWRQMSGHTELGSKLWCGITKQPNAQSWQPKSSSAASPPHPAQVGEALAALRLHFQTLARPMWSCEETATHTWNEPSTTWNDLPTVRYKQVAHSRVAKEWNSISLPWVREKSVGP